MFDMPDLKGDAQRVWKLCYPRIYDEPVCGQYYSPKTVSLQLFANTIKIQNGMAGEAELYEFQVASELVHYGVPTFWLGKDMATAIGKTVPPGEIPWFRMPMPFPAAVFMMPKGSLIHPVEGDVAFVAYGRFRPGVVKISKLVNREFGPINGGMVFLAFCQQGGCMLHWNLPLDAFGESISIAYIDEQVEFGPEHPSGMPSLKDLRMTPEDNHLMTGVAQYVFGTIMLMNSRPDLVTTGVMRKKVEKKGNRNEFWTPNVIGAHYRIKKEKVDLGGTHASPRYHWVRGAYKQQAYGPKSELRKQIWVEPYQRGLDL